MESVSFGCRLLVESLFEIIRCFFHFFITKDKNTQGEDETKLPMVKPLIPFSFGFSLPGPPLAN